MDQENTYWRQHDLFRGIILFGFSLLLFQFIVTGNIKYYIAPKMIVFSIIAMIILFLLSVMHIVRSCSKRETLEIECDCGVDHQATGRPWLKVMFYGFFILPILTGFSFPHKFLDSAVAENRGVQLNFNTATNTAAKTQAVAAANSPQSAEVSPGNPVQSEQQEGKKSAEEVFKEARFGKTEAEEALKLYKQDIIQIPDDSYVTNLSTINVYLDQFIGKKLELTGFIYRNGQMQTNETVVARFAVACCTADANVFGIDVKGNLVNKYKNDTWVKVQGTIDQMEADGIMVPMLHVDKIEPVQAPKDPYVY